MKIYRKRTAGKHLLLRIILLLIILGVGGFFFFNYFKKASAEWFDQSWFYRIPVNITNAGTVQTDYQVSIALNTSALITANKMQSNCNDIRVTDINGKQLPFWIETAPDASACNQTTTKIWTKIPLVPTTGQAVYVYYGNPSAARAQNGNNVFEFFDDFSADLNKWDIGDGGTWVIESRELSGSGGTYKPSKWSGADYIVEAKGKATSGHVGLTARAIAGERSYNEAEIHVPGLGGIFYMTPSAYTEFASGSGGSGSTANDVWYLMRFTVNGTSYRWDVKGTGVDLWETGTNGTYSSGKAGVWNWGSHAHFDDFRVRKYASTEPTTSNATEEKGPAPVAYWKFDEGSGNTVFDNSSNNNSGNLGGGNTSYKPTWQTEDMCITGKCLKFDGSNDYIDVGRPTSLTSLETGNFTVESWINPKTHIATDARYEIVAFFNPGWMVDLVNDSGNEGYRFYSGSSAYVYYTGGLNFPLTWQHVAWTINTSTNKADFYLNGVFKQEFSIGAVTASTGNFRIGVRSDGSQPFNGFIDDLKIYPYVRTSDQIKSDYNAGKSGAGGSAKSASLGNKTQDFMSNGLVGYWKMDEATGSGSTLADSSGNGNTGTAKLYGGGNTATDSAHVVGKFGNGFSFDGGDDYISATDTSNLRIGGPFAISLWWKPTNDIDTQIIFSKRIYSGQYNYYAYAENSNLSFHFHDTSSTSHSLVISKPSSGVFHHLVFAWDGTYMYIYVDGVQNKSASQGAVTPQGGAGYDLFIGTWGVNYSGPVSGVFDDFRIYNRALSSKEVSDLYNWAPGPVSWWKMDEGSGSTVYDKMGNNNITLSGGFSGTADSGSDTTKLVEDDQFSINYWCSAGKYDGFKVKSGAEIRTVASSSCVGGWGTTVWTFTFDSVISGFTTDSSYELYNEGGSGASNRGPKWSSGKFGTGISLDGRDDWATSTYTGVPAADFPVTYSAWVYVKNYPLTWSSVVVGWPWGNPSALKLSTTGYPNINVYHPDSTTTTCTSDTALSKNQWHHLAGYFDARGTLGIFVDGVEKKCAVTKVVNGGSYVIVIGSAYGVGYPPFEGMIDDIKIYNYARSTKQVLEDMNAGHPSVGSPVGSYAGYWKFDEGQGNSVKDQSVNANTGTINGATWTNDGRFGKALKFDGDNDYIDIPNNYNTALRNDVTTVSMWAKIRSVGGNTYAELYSSTGTGRTGIKWLTDRIGIDANSDFYNYYVPVNLSFNTWYHIVVIIDRTINKGTVYVNGVYKGQTNAWGAYTPGSSNTIRIGGVNLTGNPVDYLNGVIDEVKIYPFALTADDIKTEYNQGKSIVMGSLSNTSGLAGGSVASNSASAEFCIPGDTTTCNPPVGQWKMNENVKGNAKTLYDISGNNNNGTTYWGGNASGMDCTVLGKYATGCKFDGTDDYVDVGNPANLNFGTGSFTVETWVKMQAGTSGDYGGFFKGNGDQNIQSGWILRFLTYSTRDIVFCGGDGSSNVFCISAASASGLSYDTWTHVVGVLDRAAGKAYIYKNGVLVATDSTILATSISSSDSLYFARDFSASHMFKGSLDDVRIFNYARTPAQIAWDYNRGGPVGYWKFDECQGSVAKDFSGNGNHGTVTIGTTAPQTALGTCTTPVDGTGAWYDGKTGKFNSALSFDGVDDYVAFSDSDELKPAVSLTVSAWVNPTNFVCAGADANCQIYSKYLSYKGYSLTTYSSGIVVFSICAPSTCTSTSSSTALPINSWSHVMAVWNGSNIQIYINGKASGSSVAVSTITHDTTVPTVGKASWYGGNYFHGLIDDVKVYNYALTSQQILTDYNQGSAVRFGPSSGRP